MTQQVVHPLLLTHKADGNFKGLSPSDATASKTLFPRARVRTICPPWCLPLLGSLTTEAPPLLREDQVLRPVFHNRKPFGFLLLWEIFTLGLTVIVEFASGPPAVTGPRALRPLQINRNKQTNTLGGKGSPEEGFYRGRRRTQLVHGSPVCSWGPASSPPDPTPGRLLCHRTRLPSLQRNQDYNFSARLNGFISFY